MPVYVDKAKHLYRGMLMCHMVADSLDELHAMADRIGIKRQWFQADGSVPHYDICKSKRKLAVAFGAIEIGRREIVEVIRKHRNAKQEARLKETTNNENTEHR